MNKIFTHIPHPHIALRKLNGPPKVDDGHVGINGKIALWVTQKVGSMWTAYLFCLLALTSLPAVLTAGGFVGPHFFPSWIIAVGLIALVAWIAQTFFQLVLLPVIIVGQNVLGAASDKRSQQTFDDAEAVLHEAMQIQEHLQAQDDKIMQILELLQNDKH